MSASPSHAEGSPAGHQAIGPARAVAVHTRAGDFVTLREVAITGLGLSGGNVDVILSVYNPNAFNLDALGMTYRVDIDSVPLGSGQLGQRFVVQQGDSSIVRLPISFTYAGIGAVGRQLMQSGAVTYRVRGDFTVATPLGNFTRPYDQTGRYSTVMGNRR